MQIEVKNLTFTYQDEMEPALKNVSLEIDKGEFVVICGKSGCGKTTLLRHLKPSLAPFGKVSGDILYEGRPIKDMDKKDQACRIGFIMQNPSHQIVSDRVWHELAFGLENLGYGRREIQLRVTEMAEYFGITDWYDSKIDQLSGGQTQILNLASTMTMHPDIMLLDEPTSRLDPIASENFLSMLKKINDDLGVTIVISEHRTGEVLTYADKMLLMENGENIAFDTPKNIVGKVADKNQRLLMPVPSQIYLDIKECNKNRQNMSSNSEDQSVPISVGEGRWWIEKELPRNTRSIEKEQLKDEEDNAKSKKNLDERGFLKKNKSSGMDVAIACKNVWFRYTKDGKDVIKNLNLRVEYGKIFAIMGGNGVGKTTLLSLLSKINKPYRGKVEVNGSAAALPQDAQMLFKKETVKEELLGVQDELIDSMELRDLFKRHPYDISGGQQQKMALAKVLSMHPDILLLDEPTVGIDPIYKDELGRLLFRLKKENKAVLVVSHDIDFCGEFADRCALFAGGELIGEGKSKEFFSANRFYTTTVSKMANGIAGGIVKKEDLKCLLTGADTTSCQ